MEKKEKEALTCIYCRSSKVILHGKTSTGNRRYRCRHCGRTWVSDKAEIVRPDIVSLTEAYLSGQTFRDLVHIYKSSPLRINKKVREFLEGCPNWEEYLDLSVEKHNVKLAFLIIRSFSAAGVDKNQMYVSMMVDAFSNVILGFEISYVDDYRTWYNLLSRAKQRGINCSIFMFNGSMHIEEAVKKVYPNATLKLFYHRAYRDKELSCCLSRIPLNIKITNDAIFAFNTCRTDSLQKFLGLGDANYLNDVVKKSSELVHRRLKDRLVNRNKIRIEAIYNNFQSRFEKFHMLKSDPYPLVNGWISKFMVQQLDIGFSRLSIYIQKPVITNFKLFSCGQVPIPLNLQADSPKLRMFVVELAVRALQMPIFYNRCEMKFDKCSLMI